MVHGLSSAPSGRCTVWQCTMCGPGLDGGDAEQQVVVVLDRVANLVRDHRADVLHLCGKCGKRRGEGPVRRPRVHRARSAPREGARCGRCTARGPRRARSSRGVRSACRRSRCASRRRSRRRMRWSAPTAASRPPEERGGVCERRPGAATRKEVPRARDCPPPTPLPPPVAALLICHKGAAADSHLVHRAA